MIGKRSLAFGLTMALAAGCAPNTGPDEVEPTRSGVTASASPMPTRGLPPLEVLECPGLPGSYFLPLGRVAADKVCSTAAGIRGLIEGEGNVTIMQGRMPLEPLGSCILNPVIYRDGGDEYYAFARPSRRAGVSGSEVTAFTVESVDFGGASERQIVLNAHESNISYEAVLTPGGQPSDVALLTGIEHCK